MNPHQDDNGRWESLERELDSFRPTAPADDLKERIRRMAEAPPVPRRAPRSWSFQVLAGAAALCVLFGAVAIWPRGTATGSPSPESPVVEVTSDTPADLEEETLWVAEEVKGIVDTGDGPPMWKVRYETVRRTAWSDEHGATQLRFEPEEFFVFVPVNYN